MEILPCPFCGGDAALRGAGSAGNQHWVECAVTDCHAMGPNRGTPRDAATGWNRRHLDEVITRPPGAEPDEDDAL